MICLKCNSEEFVLKPDALVEQELKGEKLHIQTAVMSCAHCGWQALTDEQMDELGRKVADAYRKKHGLLTSTDIRCCREQLGFSQREFAKRIGVGEASVKRWETWLVQEKSSDQLIRLKFNEMLEACPQEQPLRHWFVQGACSPGTVVSNGIQLSPNQVQLQPLWRMPEASAVERRKLRFAYDPAIAIAA